MKEMREVYCVVGDVSVAVNTRGASSSSSSSISGNARAS